MRSGPNRSRRLRRIADAARQIAETLDLSAIICWTSSGSTALRVARERPKPPVVAITPNVATGRKLSAVWGVHCVVAEDAQNFDDMVNRAGSIAFRDGFARAGQRVIIVAGAPLGTPAPPHAAHRLCRPESDADIEARLNLRRVPSFGVHGRAWTKNRENKPHAK